jgi:hypothetical protein
MIIVGLSYWSMAKASPQISTDKVWNEARTWQVSRKYKSDPGTVRIASKLNHIRSDPAFEVFS